MNRRLEAINAVTAANELRYDHPTSVIRLAVTNHGLTDFTGRKVEESFVFSNPHEARISQINLAMLKEVEKKDGVGLWLSPPDKINQTGKILLAVRSGREIVEYDTTGVTFSGTDFAGFMTSLSAFCHDGYYFLPDMDIIESIIPMPLVWQGIKNDQAEMKFNEEVEEAMQQNDKRQFYRGKFGVDIALACGGTVATLKLVSPNGEVRVADKLYYVKNCGQCGVTIEKQISAGYCCPNCGGVYEGCG